VRPLRESLAKGDVLAGHLVDQDDEIVRSQADFLHDELVQRGEQCEALILRATRDKSQLEEDERSLYVQPTKAGVWTNCPFGRTCVMRK